jgi:hypothetical protein
VLTNANGLAADGQSRLESGEILAAQPYENRATAKRALGDIAGADLNLAKGLKQ